MDRRTLRLSCALLLLTALLGLPGCSSSDGMTGPSLDPDGQADVQASAQVVAIAGPSADAAAAMIFEMAGLIQEAAPAPAGGAARAVLASTCPAEFDLANGLSGTCLVSEDRLVFSFGGTATVDGATVSVEGSLIVALAENQPESGTRYVIDFDAGVNGERGHAIWSSEGWLTVDSEGQVVDFQLTMTHAVTPVGGSPTSVTVTVDPSRFELVLTGPLGGILVFELDRTTMTGEVRLGGIPVALVTIVNGCATIEYLVPGLPDEHSCAAT